MQFLNYCYIVLLSLKTSLMKEFISESGSLESLEKGLHTFETDKEISSLFVLACDNNGFTPENCNKILRSVNKPVWGGIFPEIIYNHTKHNRGLIILGLKKEINISIIKNISNNDTNFEQYLNDFYDASFGMNTISVIVDGFAKRISALIEALFLVFGLEHNYIGGGAGSLSMKQKPCVFTNEGLLTDCALIVGLMLECGVGVQHGWQSIAGPFKITESENNIVKAIDFKPAFEVYKEIVDSHSGKNISDANFFDIAKAYPFGINKLGAEKVVRDPIATEYGHLICVGELPEGTFIDVLHGNKKSLIRASHDASVLSSKDIPLEDRNFDLFFDCISRVLFLEDDFENELNAVNTKNVPLLGALSIGEIANNKKDYLEFYNKTAVLASFRK